MTDLDKVRAACEEAIEVGTVETQAIARLVLAIPHWIYLTPTMAELLERCCRELGGQA